jgi:hypothetical protein
MRRAAQARTLHLVAVAAVLASVGAQQQRYDCKDATDLENALEAIEADTSSSKSTITLAPGTYQLTRQMSIFAPHAVDILGGEGVVIRAPAPNVPLGCVTYGDGGGGGGDGHGRRHLAASEGNTAVRPGLEDGDDVDDGKHAMHQGGSGYMLAVCSAAAAVKIKDITLHQGDVRRSPLPSPSPSAPPAPAQLGLAGRDSRAHA